MFPHVFMCLKSHKRENSGTNCSHTRKESHIYLIIVKQNNLQLYLGCYLTGKIWGFPLLQRCVEICKVMLKKFTSRVRKKCPVTWGYLLYANLSIKLIHINLTPLYFTFFSHFSPMCKAQTPNLQFSTILSRAWLTTNRQISFTNIPKRFHTWWLHCLEINLPLPKVGGQNNFGKH